ncbi:hypothetical protein V6N13_145607 [Hibiscus sabdariffa]|uniref:Uncharacterized protein n=1 Tax=Hibiscus sabdariffa TaxID=183260 RepID=A0ABR2TQP8_9ROSI
MGCNVSKIGASKEANGSACYHFKIISRKKDQAEEEDFPLGSSDRLPEGGEGENHAKIDKNNDGNSNGNGNDNNNNIRHQQQLMEIKKKKKMDSEGEGEVGKDKVMAFEKDKTDGHGHEIDPNIDFPRSPSFNVFCAQGSMDR